MTHYRRSQTGTWKILEIFHNTETIINVYLSFVVLVFVKIETLVRVHYGGNKGQLLGVSTKVL